MYSYLINENFYFHFSSKYFKLKQFNLVRNLEQFVRNFRYLKSICFILEDVKPVSASRLQFIFDLRLWEEKDIYFKMKKELWFMQKHKQKQHSSGAKKDKRWIPFIIAFRFLLKPKFLRGKRTLIILLSSKAVEVINCF